MIPEFLFAGCTALYLALSAYILFSAKPSRTDAALTAGCVATAVWSASLAFPLTVLPDHETLSGFLELIRAVVWFGFIAHLYTRAVQSGPQTRLNPILLGAVALTILAVGVGLLHVPSNTASLLDSLEVDARLGLAVFTIVLIENVWRNASGDLRWHVALPCIAIGGACLYDILLYGDAVLYRRISPILFDGRALVTALIAPLLGLSVSRNRRHWGASLQLSRKVVFHSASLVVIGVVLLALAATGEVLRLLGSEQQVDWGIVIEVGLVCGGILGACVFLTSGSAQSGLRSLIVDNFFSQRFDYRAEWLRCIGTLSQPDAALALHTRAIRAVAQIVDSPSGLLFLRAANEDDFRWAGSWNLAPITVKVAATDPIVPLLRNGSWVMEASGAAPWIDGVADLWLAVPLNHNGRLIGFTMLSKPRSPFTLDREVFDLLRILGQETASHIAEQQAAESLLQTRQLRAYGERFAFVAHDIKNVASQLSLLLSNAEHHIANPEFQQDMLQTVSSSVQKITTLLARLRTPESERAADAAAAVIIVPAHHIDTLAAARPPTQRGRIELDLATLGSSSGDRDETCEDSAAQCTVQMIPVEFDAVITHLLDNAFEASDATAPVRIAVHTHAERVVVDISDQGTGMTADFIRDRLFMPFASSKVGGTGLGVYQARELLRGAGGDLLVTSTPGAGTTMQVSLPRANRLPDHPVTFTPELAQRS